MPPHAQLDDSRPSAPSSRDLAKTLNGLGRVYEHQGRYSEAQTLQQRALSIVESSPDNDQMTVSEALEDLEREHIRRTLESAGWRVRGTGGAGERLGLKPSTLETRMAKLGIKRPAR